MLTVKKIESAKPKEKAYKLSDTGGLYLYVTEKGTKSFRLNYRYNGKSKTLTIGQYPYISLAEARDARANAKTLLAKGDDPSLYKKKSLMMIDADNSFSKIAREWFESKNASWTTSTKDMIISYFEKDIFPMIGDADISTIKASEMLICLKSIENRGALEIARKMRQRCSEVFQYAIITNRAEINPARELSKAMNTYTPKNYPFLTEVEMREFLRALGGYSGSIIVRKATELLILTALRTKELRTLKWGDIDFQDKTLSIREEVMKKRRKHIVPLSKQALNILEFMKPISSKMEYVFTGRVNPKEPISDGAILGLIKRLGFANRASGHGFRHQFSTVLNEKGFNQDWIEKQLNHETGSVRAVYNHAQYLEQRRDMMQWYADYIDTLLLDSK